MSISFCFSYFSLLFQVQSSSRHRKKKKRENGGCASSCYASSRDMFILSGPEAWGTNNNLLPTAPGRFTLSLLLPDLAAIDVDEYSRTATVIDGENANSTKYCSAFLRRRFPSRAIVPSRPIDNSLPQWASCLLLLSLGRRGKEGSVLPSQLLTRRDVFGPQGNVQAWKISWGIDTRASVIRSQRKKKPAFTSLVTKQPVLSQRHAWLCSLAH